MPWKTRDEQEQRARQIVPYIYLLLALIWTGMSLGEANDGHTWRAMIFGVGALLFGAAFIVALLRARRAKRQNA